MPCALLLSDFALGGCIFLMLAFTSPLNSSALSGCNDVHAFSMVAMYSIIRWILRYHWHNWVCGLVISSVPLSGGCWRCFSPTLYHFFFLGWDWHCHFSARCFCLHCCYSCGHHVGCLSSHFRQLLFFWHNLSSLFLCLSKVLRCLASLLIFINSLTFFHTFSV